MSSDESSDAFNDLPEPYRNAQIVEAPYKRFFFVLTNVVDLVSDTLSNFEHNAGHRSYVAHCLKVVCHYIKLSDTLIEETNRFNDSIFGETSKIDRCKLGDQKVK